jgi:hypothetical protein
MATKRLRLVDQMQAAKTVEEDLRPNLPVTIPANATWTLQAKNLMDQSPEVYAGIVARMADGDSNNTIHKLTRLPKELIRKIRDLHPAAIEAGRKAHLARLEEALHATGERILENVDKVSVGQLPILFGVLFDKNQIASGGATTRVEHIKAPTKEDLDAMFDALPQANATVIE